MALVQIPAPSVSKNFSLLNGPSGTTLTGAQDITISGIGGYDKYLIVWQDASSVSGNSYFGIRLNGDNAANYAYFGHYALYNTTYNSVDLAGMGGTGASQMGTFGRMANSASSQLFGYCILEGTNSSGIKIYHGGGNASNAGTGGQVMEQYAGFWNNSALVTSITVRSTNGNFDNGTVRIYGSA